MKRILIHPGFHKTGTTSAQTLLRENRKLLSPFCTILLRRHLNKTYPAATEYARTGDPDFLDKFTRRFRHALRNYVPEDAEQLILTEENLFGQMPGKYGVYNYDAAPPLLGRMIEVLNEVFPGNPTIDVFLTTRNADIWMNSIWRHTVVAARITEDEETLRRKLTEGADLIQTADEIARFFPEIGFRLGILEDLAHSPWGPGSVFLDWIAPPAEVLGQVKPVGLRNPAVSRDLCERFLQLNRSDLDQGAFLAAKEVLLEEVNKQRQVAMIKNDATLRRPHAPEDPR